MALALDVKKAEGKYIKAIEVEFKPKSGEYRFYDADTQQEVLDDKFEGIVVGTGFQLRGNVGNPTKKKATNYLSDDFDMETLKNGTIGVREFVRDGANTTNRSLGKKTYAEWKDHGFNIHRTMWVIKPENLDKIYKVCFSKVASVPVGKALSPDLPNFVTKFSVDENMFETENGEFYVPKVERVVAITKEQEPKVGEWLARVKETYRNGGAVSAASAEPQVSDSDKDFIKMEEIPF